MLLIGKGGALFSYFINRRELVVSIENILMTDISQFWQVLI